MEMDKELFKSIIMRQFKEPSNPIRMLMCQIDSNLRNPSSIYKESAFFVNSEFKTQIFIDSCVIDDEAFFNIRFIDGPEVMPNEWKVSSKMDMSLIEREPLHYCFETIEIVGSKVVFSLKSTTLCCKSYEFYTENTSLIFSAEYDLSYKGFNVLDDMYYARDIDLLIKQWYSMKYVNTMFDYVDWATSKRFKNQLEKALQDVRIPGEDSELITDCFRVTDIPTDSTVMAEIVRKLKARR